MLDSASCCCKACRCSLLACILCAWRSRLSTRLWVSRVKAMSVPSGSSLSCAHWRRVRHVSERIPKGRGNVSQQALHSLQKPRLYSAAASSVGLRIMSAVISVATTMSEKMWLNTLTPYLQGPGAGIPETQYVRVTEKLSQTACSGHWLGPSPSRCPGSRRHGELWDLACAAQRSSPPGNHAEVTQLDEVAPPCLCHFQISLENGEQFVCRQLHMFLDALMGADLGSQAAG